MKKGILSTLLLILTFTGISAKGSITRPKAPDFRLPTVFGDTLSLSDYYGKVVILNFWATWCPPCRAEIPGFIKLQKEFEDQGFTFIGIALDKQQKVEQFYKDYKMNYPVVIGNQEVSAAYGGITGIPTTFVLDREGRIVKKYVGMRPEKVFREDIVKLLSEPKE